MTGLPIDRRALLAAGLVGGAAASLAMPAAASASAGETIALWPGSPPGGQVHPIAFVEEQSAGHAFADRRWRGIDLPRLIVRSPARANGTAALIVPGGGYVFEAYDNEGEEQARWLTALGVTCFILAYRLPAEGWRRAADAPLQDAQRAVRVIRAQAARFGVRADRVMVLGFSAGGHLAGSLATRHADPLYAPVDAADALPARPDLAALIYPVVTLAGADAHAGSRDALLGAGASEARRLAYSVERHVDAATPPVFLAHAGDDGVVPVANSLMLYAALHAAGRRAELHVFAEGGHGFGVRLPADRPAAVWPRLLTAYARREGILAAR